MTSRWTCSRHGGIRPGWRAVVRCELEGEARRPVVRRDHCEIVGQVGNRLAEQPGVEGGEGSRVGAVDHHVMQSSEHYAIMTDAVIRGRGC